MESKSYKTIIIGDGGTGKTTLCKRNHVGENFAKYLPTVGAEVTVHAFESNQGEIAFNCWDTAGGGKYCRLRDVYYKGADCAIIMYDLSDTSTMDVAQWYQDIQRVCGTIPILICGNKVDKSGVQSIGSLFHFLTRTNLPLLYISAKYNYKYIECFTQLAKMLTKNEDLEIIKFPQLKDPGIELDMGQITLNEQKLKEATRQL